MKTYSLKPEFHAGCVNLWFVLGLVFGKYPALSSRMLVCKKHGELLKVTVTVSPWRIASEIPTSALLLLLYRVLAKMVTWAVAAFLDACICMTLSPVERRLLYFPGSFQNSPSVPARGVCATTLIYKAQASHIGFLLGVHALEFLEEAVGLFAGSLSPCQASVQGWCVRF